jgi:hypothetical protein
MVVMGQQAAVRLDQTAVPLAGRHALTEARPLLREEPADVAREPADLALRRGRDRAEDDLADALGMALGVGKAERRAPREAEHQPPLDGAVTAQQLDVSEQVLGVLVLRSTAGSPACGVLLPQPRWSNSTIR